MASIKIKGDTSGEITISSPAVAGTNTLTLPAETGTLSTYTDSDALSLFNASGSAPVYACRAWVNFKGTGTVAIIGSGNVSSITDNAVGLYTLNFTTSLPDGNYAVASLGMGNTTMSVGGIAGPIATGANTKTTSALKVRFRDTAANATDVSDCSFVIFR